MLSQRIKIQKHSRRNTTLQSCVNSDDAASSVKKTLDKLDNKSAYSFDMSNNEGNMVIRVEAKTVPKMIYTKIFLNNQKICQIGKFLFFFSCYLCWFKIILITIYNTWFLCMWWSLYVHICIDIFIAPHGNFRICHISRSSRQRKPLR